MSLFTSGYTGVEIDEGIRRTYEVFSNRNLLHNWDFRNPVNQRGQSSYTTDHAYCIDRWRTGTQDITLTSAGITATGFSYNFFLRQHVENPSLYAGKTVTFSILEDLSGTAHTFDIRTDGTTVAVGTVTAGTNKIASVTAKLPASITTSLEVNILSENGSVVTLKAAKLELGGVSTLANDPPADFGEQLALCKRFYRLWTTEAARTEALKEVGLMRLASPTLSTINIGGTDYYAASADL